jgi:outer membrane protein assembly factor BamB
VAGGPAPAVEWPTYLGDAARSGLLRGTGTASQGASQQPRYDWSTPGLDGQVYASPIVAGGLVLVATENDTVYAFDAVRGTNRWTRHLGQPVAASSLPCGDIQPVSGVTGTPVADPVRGLVYVVAFERRGGRAQHVLYTLDLASGSGDGRVVDPPGASPLTHQQRGALALANGFVYVPYGGLFGDCGAYQGWVVGAPVGASVSGSAAASPSGPAGGLIGHRVPCDRECGIWAPGGPTVDSSGDLWVSTGNGEPTSRFTDANSVLRLSPDLRLLDVFAPSNWASLSDSDTDLGSISPVLVGDSLVWISGKEGKGFLLRRNHLGGVGGQAYSGAACPSWSSAMYVAPIVYLACSGSVTAVRVDASRPSFSVAWEQPLDAPGGTIMACGRLWTIDTGSGTLYALDPDNRGRQQFSYRGGSARHFVTPAAATGHVYAALGGKLVAVACS